MQHGARTGRYYRKLTPGGCDSPAQGVAVSQPSGHDRHFLEARAEKLDRVVDRRLPGPSFDALKLFRLRSIGAVVDDVRFQIVRPGVEHKVHRREGGELLPEEEVLGGQLGLATKKRPKKR